MKIVSTLILICFSLCPVQADPLSQPLKALDQHITQQIEAGKAVGCAVAVISQGKVVFTKAYGVKKKGESDPVDLNTVFQLGSVSKPIAATLIGVLQKKKLLSVKDAMVTYYPNVSPHITLEHLLSHTAGYIRKGWNNKIEAGETRETLLPLLVKSKHNVPGEIFDYHNLGYSLLEEAIAKTCQQPFEEALETKLFVPLGMTQTTAGFTKFNLQKNRVWPHQQKKDKSFYPSKQYSHLYHKAVCASAGVNSTIQDMARFLQLQMGYQQDILTAQDLTPFHTPLTPALDGHYQFKEKLKSSHYGLGWRIIEYTHGRLVFHGGYLKGFGNFVAFMPDQDIGIVVLHNGEGPFAKDAAMTFFDAYKKREASGS